MPYVRRRRVVLGALVAVAACQESALEPRPPEVPVVVPASVTPEVASALGPDGRFVEGRLAPQTVDGFSSADAEDIVFRHLRIFGPFHQKWFSQSHGAAIQVDRLRVCRTTRYAEPSVTVADTVGAPRLVKEFTEGAFLVSLCREGESLVAVLYSVTPSAANYRFEDGLWMWPDGGLAIRHEGIIRGQEPYPSAEEGVQAAWRAAGIRVARLPRLVRAHPAYGGAFARWVLPLERPAHLRVAERNTQAEQVAFGLRLERPYDRPTLLAAVRDSIPELLRRVQFTDAKDALLSWDVIPRSGYAVFYAPALAAEGR